MSVFDELDDIPTEIQDGTYLCTLEKASIEKGKKDDRSWFIIRWIVDEDDPNYPGEEIPEIYRVCPGMKPEDFLTLDPEERRTINRARKFREDRLRSLGIPEAELNNVDFDLLTGKKAYLNIQLNTGRDGVRKFIQVNTLKLANEVEETSFSLT